MKLKFKLHQIHLACHELVREVGVNSTHKAFWTIPHPSIYSKAYLFRIFKAKTGKTIMSYYLELKISEAKKLLRENELSVREISEKLAFSAPTTSQKPLNESRGLPHSSIKDVLRDYNFIKKGCLQRHPFYLYSYMIAWFMRYAWV